MIFNQTEFGHIAMQRRLRLRWRHGRTCSGNPRLPSLKRRKQGVDGRDKRGHDGWVSATAIANGRCACAFPADCSTCLPRGNQDRFPRLFMATARRILIVDDDTELREALVEQLSIHEEFEAISADTGAKGVQAAKGGQIDLVIMDVGLPDIDGREAVRILRKNSFKAPIIMLTGHDTDSDTILGLEAGANDYVAKPFRFAVLLARIRAQLRQHEASEDAVFIIGPYSFQPSSKLLMGSKGNKVRLTEKETAILRFLYRAGQKSISREILLQEVWGYNSGVTTHTLETHIYRLRQKIEKDAAMPEILVTEAGGYKLVP